MFTQPSAVPIPNGRPVVNDGFGNRCAICGNYFDERGTCNNLHQQGQTYYYQPEEQPVLRPAEPKSAVTVMVTCHILNGCKCSICGGFFTEGDDVCGLGKHQAGQQYPKAVSS